VEVSGPTDWSARLASCARRFAAGDVSALGRLFDLTAPRLLRYAQTLTRSRDDAEDAVQAAIVRVARNPRSLAVVQLPWAYLLKIVRNETLRLMARRKPSVELGEGHAVSPPAELPIFFLEQQIEVQTALKRLPAEQAEVVVLKIWEELTFQEIATVTGESANTVASRYRYALTKLECSLKRLASEVGYVVQ
jgi:RNA polymerase sigma-70 factor (ECF subfamily)